MSEEHRQNFNDWYAVPLRQLMVRPEAGFIVLTVSLALLERYLREKSGVGEAATLSDTFFGELALSLHLSDAAAAKDFWQVFRHGLLHQMTISTRSRSGRSMPRGNLTQDQEVPVMQMPEAFGVQPAHFCQLVLTTIEQDFQTFLGTRSVNHPLPIVDPHTQATTTSALSLVYLPPEPPF